MKLNLECVRDILFAVENMADGRVQFIYYNKEQIQSLIDQHENLYGYSVAEVDYHFIQCINFGYLTGASQTPGGFNFVDLSPTGHEFVNNIRNDNVWSKTKEKVKPLGTVSLNIISQVAASIIKSGLGLL